MSLTILWLGVREDSQYKINKRKYYCNYLSSPKEIIEDLSLPSDFFEFINQKDLVTLPEEEINLSLDVESENEEEGEGGSNVVTIGGEDKQITNNAVDPTTTSNIFVKPTFSDNSKISYILEYGAGAVV